MNRRNFFRALSALAALPFVPRFLKAQPILPITAAHPWDIDRYDQHCHWITEDAEKGPWSEPQMYRLDGPEMMDWGGDVGLKPTYIHTMQYGDIREKSYYADGFGLVHMTGERLVNGVYVVEWVITENTRNWETVEA